MQDTTRQSELGNPKGFSHSMLAAPRVEGRAPVANQIVGPGATLGGRAMEGRRDDRTEQSWLDHPLVLGLLMGFALGLFLAVMNL